MPVQKDSATWRAVVTSLETFAALIVAVVAIPEFGTLVAEYYPQAVPVLTVAAGVASFVLNFFRKDVPNI